MGRAKAKRERPRYPVSVSEFVQMKDPRLFPQSGDGPFQSGAVTFNTGTFDVGSRSGT